MLLDSIGRKGGMNVRGANGKASRTRKKKSPSLPRAKQASAGEFFLLLLLLSECLLETVLTDAMFGQSCRSIQYAIRVQHMQGVSGAIQSYEVRAKGEGGRGLHLAG